MGFLKGRVAAVIVGPNRKGRLWLASLLIVVAAVAALDRPLAEPSLGWRFVIAPDAGISAVPLRPGLVPLHDVTALQAGGERVPLNAALVIESAAFHNTHSQQNAFFAAHERLWRLLQAPEVEIVHAGGIARTQPTSRELHELGPRFWFPWLVALLSASVGLGIWVYQPRNSATACYLIASGAYALGMLVCASWGSRLLTQPPQAWEALHVASRFASFLVLAGLCALLWLHPRRLGGSWLLWLLAAAIGLSVAADAGQWSDAFVLTHRLPMVAAGTLLGAVYALQWRATRADAAQRAQIKWFGLLLAAGLSAAFISYVVGATGRIIAVPQVYGMGIVALLFLGLVPLVTRVGLFRLEGWWPRAWLWFLGGLLVVALDLILVTALDWGADLAFSVALALAGWLYFPLRQALWQRLAQGSLPETRQLLPHILELVTQGHGDPARLAPLWRRLWDTVFQPLHTREAAAGSAAGIGEDGRMLRVAAGSFVQMLELELPERGGRLFNPADAKRAREICELVQQALAASEAYERGTREERRRIASDLHDDLGAQLLTIAQVSRQAHDTERVAGMARRALEEMRLAVRGLAGDAAAAQDVLADWRAECVSRLDAAGWQAGWHAEEPPAGLVLPARTRMQLTRVLREAVSNAIRHSGGRRCQVRIGFAEDNMHVEVEDDGRGLPESAFGHGAGHGLPNIERRVRSLGGRHGFEPAEAGGTRLKLEIPLAVRSANIDAL